MTPEQLAKNTIGPSFVLCESLEGGKDNKDPNPPSAPVLRGRGRVVQHRVVDWETGDSNLVVSLNFLHTSLPLVDQITDPFVGEIFVGKFVSPLQRRRSIAGIGTTRGELE